MVTERSDQQKAKKEEKPRNLSNPGKGKSRQGYIPNTKNVWTQWTKIHVTLKMRTVFLNETGVGFRDETILSLTKIDQNASKNNRGKNLWIVHCNGSEFRKC